MQNICIYCASSTQIKSTYFEAAALFGKILAENKINVVFGGGASGLMGKLADSILENNGNITGVIPQFMCDEEWHHTKLSELIVVDTMHERKEKMAMMSDAAVALPGGCGTLEELLEVITWKQLGIFNKPIVIVNIEGYFNPLIEMLNRAVEENFMRNIHLDIWTVVDHPVDVLPAIYNAPAWDNTVRKFAAI